MDHLNVPYFHFCFSQPHETDAGFEIFLLTFWTVLSEYSIGRKFVCAKRSILCENWTVYTAWWSNTLATLGLMNLDLAYVSQAMSYAHISAKWIYILSIKPHSIPHPELEQRKCWFSSDNSHWGLSNACLHQSYEELDNFAWLCRLHYMYVWTSCFSFLWSRYCTLWWFYKWPLTFLPVFAHKVCFTISFRAKLKVFIDIVQNACVLVSSD